MKLYLPHDHPSIHRTVSAPFWSGRWEEEARWSIQAPVYKISRNFKCGFTYFKHLEAATAHFPPHTIRQGTHSNWISIGISILHGHKGLSTVYLNMDVFQYLCCFTIIGFLNIFLVCTINIDKNIVLASVYDAMKSNVHPKNHNYNYNHKDNHNSAVSVKKMNLLSDLRDKRQDNEYYRRHGYYNDYDE